MNHLTSEVLRTLFSPREIIDIVREGIIKYSEGKYDIPERTHIDRGTSTTLIMPAFGPKYNCTKLVSVNPENHSKNLPIINGILVLNDNETGQSLATFDTPMITALRTAAIGSIGIDLIWKQNKVKMGVIGLGVQGFWQTIFAASTKSITEIYCTSRSEAKFSSYKALIAENFPDIKIIYCSSAEQVVEKSQVIVACTTSNSPVFTDEQLNISEKRFVSVGSFTKSMQELPEHVYRQADALIIDSKTAKSEVGDVIQVIKNNWIPHANIYTLADVLSGKATTSEHDNIVFKSVGMAAFDLALASASYEKFFKVKN